MRLEKTLGICSALMIVVPAIIAIRASAQPAAAVEFDVVSVKRAGPTPSAGIRFLPGRFEMTSFPLKPLIARAYGVPNWKVVDGPGWINTDRFEIQGTMPQSSTAEQVKAMLRTLLERRFKLSVQAESRLMDTDLLVQADPNGPPGAGLHSVSVDCETNRLREGSAKGLFPEDARPNCGTFQVSTILGAGRRSVKYAAFTMEDFANALSGAARPVLNRTGLDGQFDIALDYVAAQPLSAAPADVASRPAGPSQTEALAEQLGLKLRKERNTVEFLKVRSVEMPQEN
jgi:uncharacterized protein (TIGR03435 family)